MRIDGLEKVKGFAKFCDDIKINDSLFAVPVHTGKPSAKILKINIEEALKIPGVVKIITSKDVPGSNRLGGIISDHYLFATDRSRYAGDIVTLVVAKSLKAANKCISKIKIKYKNTKGVFNPEDSLKKGSPLIHPERNSNLVAKYHIKKGDIKKAFKKSFKSIEAKFKTSFIEHAYLEPESAIAIPNPDGSIIIYGGMQHPFSTRRAIAAACGLPLAKVRVIQTTLGGGFGGKDDTMSYVCARTAIAAVLTNKPVKCTYTRKQSMIESYKRHPFIIDIKLSTDKNGKLTALNSSLLADAGPYCSTSPFVIWRPTVQCTGPYLIPNVQSESRAVYTNNTFTGAMRGFGSPQHVFASESSIDMMANELGIDPFEFRKKNFFKTNDKIHTGEKLNNHKVAISEVTKKCLDELGWKTKFNKCSKGKIRKDGTYYGVGFACSYRGVSLGAEGSDFSSAVVNIQEDGSVILQTGVSENGQGLKSAMTLILAESLGIKTTQIHFLDTDTSNIPDGGPTVASRGTIMGGQAILNAVSQIKPQLKPILIELIGKSTKEYEFKNGKIFNKTNKKSVTFKRLSKKCFKNRIYPYALGIYKGPNVNWNDAKGQGKAYFTYVYGCQACELTVDSKTGKVSVQKVIAVHDAGKIINKQMAEGQVFGGIMMGLGFALMENANHQNGILKPTGFANYKIPRSIDTPEMKAMFVENTDNAGPYGSKSLGEPTNELMGAAVANAVFWATGVRFTTLPITKEKILKSLRGI